MAHDGILGSRKLSKADLTSPWAYWWDDPNDRFYVYSIGNPTSLVANIEIGTRDYCVITNGTDDITFSNLDFRHARNFAFSCLWDSDNWTFHECSFSQLSRYCLQFNNGSDRGAVTDCTFTDWGVIDGQQYAIQVIAFDHTETGPVDITGCTFELTQGANVTECLPVMQDNGGWVRTFSNNAVYGNGHVKGSGVVFWRPASMATTIDVENNLIQDVSHSGIILQELEFHGALPVVRVRYNVLKNTCLGDILDTEGLRLRAFSASSDVTIAYNIISNVVDGAHAHHGIQVNGASRARIWNNIIISADNGIEVNTLGVTVSVALDIRNNIVMGNRGYGLNLGSSCGVTLWGHNCWFKNTLGNFSGIVPGAGDITDDPGFQDAVSADFRLLAASPCIDAGHDVGQARDFEGNAIQGLPDIGAFEYSLGAGAPTASASATPDNGQAPLMVSFTGNATGGVPPYGYSWNFGDGQSSALQNPSHTFSAASTYNVVLTVTDSQSATAAESLVIVATSSGDSTYMLSVSSQTGSPSPGQGGTTEPSSGNYSYSAGTTVLIKSVINDSYRFSRWTDDTGKTLGYASDITTQVDRPKSVSANFCARCGDLTGDLKITPSDAQKAFDMYLMRITNPTICELENADVNCSGTPGNPMITPADAQWIFNRYLGKGDLPPGDCSGAARVAVATNEVSAEASSASAVPFAKVGTEAGISEDVRIPILIDSSQPVSVFGFDCAFPKDSLAFLGIERTDYTEKFDQIGANQISGGLVRVGGYTVQPVTRSSPAALLALVFRVINKVSAPISISVINVRDNLRHAHLQAVINQRPVDDLQEGRSQIKRTRRKSNPSL